MLIRFRGYQARNYTTHLTDGLLANLFSPATHCCIKTRSIQQIWRNHLVFPRNNSDLSRIAEERCVDLQIVVRRPERDDLRRRVVSTAGGRHAIRGSRPTSRVVFIYRMIGTVLSPVLASDDCSRFVLAYFVGTRRFSSSRNQPFCSRAVAHCLEAGSRPVERRTKRRRTVLFRVGCGTSSDGDCEDSQQRGMAAVDNVRAPRNEHEPQAGRQ